MAKPKFLSLVVVATAAFLLCDVAVGAQTPTLITSSIDEGRIVAVAHSTHPLAKSELDRGAAPDNLALDRMLLVLKRSPDRQAALDQYLAELQQPGSPNYHKWLTPQQFGEQFGASDSDIQSITAWLRSHGFRVEPVAAGRGVIEFSGNAGQVRQAFHTEIHKFSVKGVDHWANASDQQIPAALGNAVSGIATLHDFRSAPQLVGMEKSALVTPDLTSGSGNHYLSPNDYATIYNANPLYPAINGAGVTIAIVGRTNINVQDVISFRSVFGLPANPPHIIVNGTDPGDLGDGEEAEAVLDTSWAGVLAPGATVDLIVSASTVTTDGVDLSELYIINNNLANVMSESFGSCEASYTASQAALISANAQQAAAQGISYTVSAGDAGSAGCDNFNAETVATGPVSVNALASSPYTVAVGGTQFYEGGTPSLFWNATNNATYGSALSYIPEDVWNANCTNGVCGTGSILAGGGGASVFFAKPSWQSGVSGIPADGARDLPDVSLTAAGHDPYLFCLLGSCSSSPPGFYTVYGTSASAPSFAGIIALLNQKAGARLGQLTPRLYALAAAENLSACNASNTTALPASNCIFNDVTVGTNAVPGEANYNTSNETYPAGVGYDRASGLGSVNVANLVNSWNVSVTAPNASVTPTSLTFPAQADGTTSAAQAVTLSNAGSASLSISGIAISGANASDFAATNTCGSSLTAGSSCGITVTFTPTAAGSRSANLVVTDNSGNVAGSTQTVSLTGTGTTTSSATATYIGSDATTLGNWKGVYGANGEIIPDDSSNMPSYATVSITGAQPYLWTNSTTDPRALLQYASTTARIASTYYANSFTIDVNLTDGNTHKLSLYLCEWDNNARTEAITIVDANSQAVLSTQTFSNFNGTYAEWTLSGHVQIKVVQQVGSFALVNGIFFDAAAGTTAAPNASLTPTSLTFSGQTVGTTSGAQAVTLANTGTASLSISSIVINGANASDFATSNTCGTSLAAGSTCGISVTFTPSAAGTRSANLVFTDNSGNVAGATQTVPLTGNATTTGSATATYIGADTTTLGNWKGVYGANGEIIPDDSSNIPSYATVNITGAQPYLWTNSTTDPRALLQYASTTARIASTYYANSFTIDVNLTDGNTHKLSLYLCEWDNNARTESITIVDANSQAVLSTQTFSNFNGTYAQWALSGHVQIKVVQQVGSFALVNGLFFDAPPNTSPVATASYLGADTTTLGNWKGVYGADGEMIPDDSSNIPGYAAVNITGAQPYLWTNSTTDPRALLQYASTTARIASTYYANSFTIDVNLADGNTHKLSLYLLQWDNNARTESITFVDANSQAVLSTQTFSNFNGTYAQWNVSGHVQIKVVQQVGSFALVNGIFFH